MHRNKSLLVLGSVSLLALSACGGQADPDLSAGGTVQAAPTTPAAGTGNADGGTTGNSAGEAPAGGPQPGMGGAAGSDGGSLPGTAGSSGNDAGTAVGAPAAGAGDLAAHQRHPAAQRTCLEKVAQLSGTPAAELVVTGTARTQAGVEVRVQRQELRSAWTCQTDAQGGTVLGVQDGRAS